MTTPETIMSDCWAYGPAGRCSLKAGHRVKHLIKIEWSDQECIVPGTPSLTLVPDQQDPLMAQLAEEAGITPEVVPQTCVVCSHTDEHKLEGCVAKGCECLNAVYP